jgi:MFS family permease
LLLIGVVFFLNAGPSFVRPIIPLQIEAFDPGLGPETLAGIAFAALSITSAGAAFMSSRVSGLVGPRNALALATAGAGLAYLGVSFANGVGSLIVLIGVVGVFSGGMVPTANALIDRWTPPGKHASAFGLAGSAMALAFAIAPLSGGFTASQLGIQAAFTVIGIVMIGVALGVLALVRAPEEREAVEPARAAG